MMDVINRAGELRHSIETGNQIPACMALQWNETKDETALEKHFRRETRIDDGSSGSLQTIEIGSDFGSPALLMMVVAKAIDLIGFASDTRRCGALAVKPP
jgi:hypothetical protein